MVGAAPVGLADPDARRQPARMELARTAGGLAVALALEGGRPLRLPGVADRDGATVAELASIAFDVMPAGLAVTAVGTDGRAVALALEEGTGRALATALVLTFRAKLTRADRAEADSGFPAAGGDEPRR